MFNPSVVAETLCDKEVNEITKEGREGKAVQHENDEKGRVGIKKGLETRESEEIGLCQEIGGKE